MLRTPARSHGAATRSSHVSNSDKKHDPIKPDSISANSMGASSTNTGSMGASSTRSNRDNDSNQSRPDTNRDGSANSAAVHISPRLAPLRINGTEPHNQHAMFPDWAGDWSKNNVVDQRSGTTRRREGDSVRRGTAPAQMLEAAESNSTKSETDSPGDTSGLASASRRRGAGRRLSDFGRCAEEGDFNPEQFMFVMAIDAFKRANALTFPAWTDVLEIIRLLGYRKTCCSELDLRSAEDWTERPDAKSNVRPDNWEKRAA